MKWTMPPMGQFLNLLILNRAPFPQKTATEPAMRRKMRRRPRSGSTTLAAISCSFNHQQGRFELMLLRLEMFTKKPLVQPWHALIICRGLKAKSLTQTLPPLSLTRSSSCLVP